MSKTNKDSARDSTRRITLKVTVNHDGSYEIVLNEKVVGKCIPESWLDAELCAKHGFCGEELVEIKRQLLEHGSAVLTL